MGLKNWMIFKSMEEEEVGTDFHFVFFDLSSLDRLVRKTQCESGTSLPGSTGSRNPWIVHGWGSPWVVHGCFLFFLQIQIDRIEPVILSGHTLACESKLREI